MSVIPEKIADFIAQHHVVSIACGNSEQIWAANCFYAFDPSRQRLIVLSASKTLHAQLMRQYPQIAGTISTATETIQEIEGIQFTALARCLDTAPEKQLAQQCYFARHPMAKSIPSDVWELKLQQIKHTQNKHAFAQKSYWNASL